MGHWFCLLGWGEGGEGGEGADAVKDSYPPTICHTCAALETWMLSKTDQEITPRLINALNVCLGLSDLWAVHGAGAASPMP